VILGAFKSKPILKRSAYTVGIIGGVDLILVNAPILRYQITIGWFGILRKLMDSGNLIAVLKTQR